jgi:ribosomal protein S18 acetylase RimI-like enzyme
VSVPVRRGAAEDLAFARDLGRRTVMDSVWARRPAIPALVEASFERLLDFVLGQPHALFVATENGADLGFLLLLDEHPDEVTLEREAFVAYMAVEPEARNRGIGRALLDAAEAHARDRGLHYVAMMVTDDNLPARTLYERSGFLLERRLLCKPL